MALLAPELEEQIDRQGLRRLLEDVELPLASVLARMEARGVRSTSLPGGDGGVGPRPDGDAARRGLPARRAGVQPELAAAAPGDPLRPAGACSRGSRRPRASSRPTRASWRSSATRIRSSTRSCRGGSWTSSTPRTSRRSPAGRREGRAPPHVVQPDRRRHGPAVLLEPQPAEHPDPVRAGPADPPRVHPRRGRPGPPRRRLLADRAAHPRPPVRRRRAARGVRLGPRHPRGDGGHGVRPAAGARRRGDAPTRRRR